MKKKPQQAPLWARTGHQKPVTRRDFLAAGLIPFSAAMLAPAWTTLLLPQTAHAADACGAVGDLEQMIPFISVNLSGGSAMASNFLPMGQDGNPISSYSVMGLGDGQVPIEREFGGATFAGLNNGALLSKFLQGIRETAATAITNTAFVGQCVRSRDDSGENRFSAAGLLSGAGVNGLSMPYLGARSTRTGINQESAVAIAPAPLVVRSYTDLSSSLQYAGVLGTSLTAGQRNSLSKLIANLTGQQTRHLASLSTGKEIQKLVDCAGIKNVDIVSSGGGGTDPRTDTNSAQLNPVWGIDTNTGANNQNLIFAAMAYNVLKGNSGAASLELGGYDYHDNSRATGDARDLDAGRLIGRLLNTAAIMSKPLFIYVTSDGAVSSPNSADRNAVWSSDRGIAGASYILYYDPKGRRQVSNHQIGWFTNDQAADDKFVTGGSPELATVAVIANYLQLNNKLSLLNTLAPRTLENLDLVLRFG